MHVTDEASRTSLHKIRRDYVNAMAVLDGVHCGLISRLTRTGALCIICLKGARRCAEQEKPD